MVQFLYCLVHVLKLFQKVTYLFPIRGHSYLPNDQDFGLIGKKKKLATKVEVPEMWDKAVKEARKHPSPFDLKVMTHEDFFDMKNAVEPLFLKTPKHPLKLHEVRMMMFEKDDKHIYLRKSYYGPWERHIVRNKNYHGDVSTLDLSKLYESPPGLKPAKKRDLLNLIQYLEDPAHRQYYELLLQDLASNAEDPTAEENVEIDNDDNSDGCDDN